MLLSSRIRKIQLSSVAAMAVFLMQHYAVAAQPEEQFVAGEDYVVLDQPVTTRDANKVEVVKAFSYGCPPCYGMEPAIAQWRQQQTGDVDFWQFPAVWNEPMELYAKAYFTAQELGVLGIVHWPLFTAIVVEQKQLSTEGELAAFFAQYAVDTMSFSDAFQSRSVATRVAQAEARVRAYRLASAPEFVVNGKYRVDRMRAGGLLEMLDVVDFLVRKERGKPAE